MTPTTTINGLIQLVKAECARLAKLKEPTYNPAMKTAIESVLDMLITKSGNDAKVSELALKVREALK